MCIHLALGEGTPHPHPPWRPPAPTSSVCRAVWASSALRWGHERQAILGHVRSFAELELPSGKRPVRGGSGGRRYLNRGKASPSDTLRRSTGWPCGFSPGQRSPVKGGTCRPGAHSHIRSRSSQTPRPRATLDGAGAQRAQNTFILLASWWPSFAHFTSSVFFQQPPLPGTQSCEVMPVYTKSSHRLLSAPQTLGGSDLSAAMVPSPLSPSF